VWSRTTPERNPQEKEQTSKRKPKYQSKKITQRSAAQSLITCGVTYRRRKKRPVAA
jgi:hypothetical protein